MQLALLIFPVLPCGDYYCFNEGTCEMDGSGKEYCQCPEGYSGEYCLTNDDSQCFTCSNTFLTAGHVKCWVLSCSSSNTACFCLNGGSCVTEANVTTCTCPDGFLGNQCEIQICKSRHTLNHCPYTMHTCCMYIAHAYWREKGLLACSGIQMFASPCGKM